MEYPKISIVTPVYNQVQFIERAIRSVVDQNYPNLEYIVVDGGSTDGTLEIIEKYKSRITRFISGPDNGLYDALNKGFSMSTGELMAWLNSDDMYHDKSLFIVAEIFSSDRTIEFLMGHKTTYDENDRCFVNGTLRNWSRYDFYLEGSQWGIQQESTFWKRSLWERAGAYISTAYKLAGDCELWTRFLIDANAQLHMTNALLGGFRVRDNQLGASSNGRAYQDEVKRIYDQVKKTPADLRILKKIAFYRKYLIRIPVLRFIFPWNKNYEAFFNYPLFIKYNFNEKRFVKSRY
jgi:glycosyltransferase involved in cell wall biosynthesis